MNNNTKNPKIDNATSLHIICADGSKRVCKPTITDGSGNRVFDGQWERLARAVEPDYTSFYTV